VVDAKDMIVLPGLVDAHTHLWHTRPRGAAAGFWGFHEYLRYVVHPLRPDGLPSLAYPGCERLAKVAAG
jgi:cytosine/adenosine deaminase-related metal-dependent hydrolase